MRRHRPTTMGGSTMGMSSAASRIALPGKRPRASRYPTGTARSRESRAVAVQLARLSRQEYRISREFSALSKWEGELYAAVEPIIPIRKRRYSAVMIPRTIQNREGRARDELIDGSLFLQPIGKLDFLALDRHFVAAPGETRRFKFRV